MVHILEFIDRTSQILIIVILLYCYAEDQGFLTRYFYLYGMVLKNDS